MPAPVRALNSIAQSLLWLDMLTHWIDCSMKHALVETMHLGQTATYLAELFNRPEPTLQMLARLLRDAPEQWIKKGGRGRSAHHLTNVELSNFLIAYMACPDSPALAIERLPHFSSLQLESETGHKSTFGEAFALLLTRMAGEKWSNARDKSWKVIISIDMSTASICEDFDKDDESCTLDHVFFPDFDASDDNAGQSPFPFYSGLGTTVEIGWLPLVRIAKVILAGEPDPHAELMREIREGL